MAKVFIDGSSGTTGLKIYDRLLKRSDIELLRLPDELRKDKSAKKEVYAEADIVFLCLPDAAAREALSLLSGTKAAVIDSSTAHRTEEGWTYGFPELIGRETIAASKRVANPGCHASGFIALTAPLVKEGFIKRDVLLSCFSLTGYSGGGKKMIAEYESEGIDPLLKAPRQYALTQQHKHLKEMMYVSGLCQPPVFCPIVADFYSGMEVTVSLFRRDMKGSLKDIEEIYKATYSDGLVSFMSDADESGFLSAAAYSGRDDMQLCVFGNEERVILTARFDNLGKGASGAAIQNMNIILGADEKLGLNLG